MAELILLGLVLACGIVIAYYIESYKEKIEDEDAEILQKHYERNRMIKNLKTELVMYYSYCPGCGARRPKNAKACPYCGVSLIKSDEWEDVETPEESVEK